MSLLYRCLLGVALFSLTVFIGCSSDDSKKETQDDIVVTPSRQSFSDWQPGQRLHPYQFITPGMTVAELHQIFPNMGDPQAEGGSPTLKQRGLTEFTTHVRFDGKPVGAEFNFRHDSLYSYYFTVASSDWSKKDRTQWHQILIDEWTRAWGETEPEEQAEGAYQATSHFWKRDGFDAVITKSVSAGGPPIISWGIQEPHN